ncbi:MAG: imidazole glycerol phosphate synthase subunit HisH [Candidatus Omnitrophica bacterium]|nr:imidazole glycerol phosphate synthase subunit HisH [Candidatus Omnitrophota bacterium]
MIAIIDYGMGNLRSVLKAFEEVNSKAFITSSPVRLLKADKVVLPGVGAFGDAIREIKKRNLYNSLNEFIEKKRLFFGICLGMQLLFKKSEESSTEEGLSVLEGEVIGFSPTRKLKVPQIGWNQVELIGKHPLFKGIEDRSYFYFAHSYYVKPKQRSIIKGVTDYGVRFSSFLAKENIFAVQFHPEKSQKTGLKILKNFDKL